MIEEDPYLPRVMGWLGEKFPGEHPALLRLFSNRALNVAPCGDRFDIESLVGLDVPGFEVDACKEEVFLPEQIAYAYMAQHRETRQRLMLRKAELQSSLAR